MLFNGPELTRTNIEKYFYQLTLKKTDKDCNKFITDSQLIAVNALTNINYWDLRVQCYRETLMQNRIQKTPKTFKPQDAALQ